MVRRLFNALHTLAMLGAVPLGGLADTLTVRDEQTGATRTYENGESFCGGADIEAFPEERRRS